ncbi:MAG: peptide chain release factor N(5)-glutamine methyltransferase [Burkholderiales bacterium]|nr:peptide chain release factor N(5)-glutamine methyltransferase [Burkholderiales bacterium]
MNIRTALADRRLPRLELRMLLGHVMQCDFAWLVAHDLDTLDDTAAQRFDALVARRVAGEPVAYLIGEREFYGRRFSCAPVALIPRPETELVVEHALARLRDVAAPRILDVGTGTGCIAVTLALERADAQVIALDVSAPALELARSNALALGAANVQCLQSNWFSGLEAEATREASGFDLIVSNPPYIVPGDPHLTQGDLRHEPALALADAVDGLHSYRELARGAVRHLRPGGWLVVEHGFDQGDTVPAVFRGASLGSLTRHADLAGLPRVCCAQRVV